MGLLNLCRQILKQYLKLGHDHFLRILSNIIFAGHLPFDGTWTWLLVTSLYEPKLSHLLCSAMVPMVTRRALLHDWSSSTAKSCVLWPLKTAMQRKQTVRRIQDTANHGHTDAVKGCSSASGIAVSAGCRNVRGTLYRQPIPVTPLHHPTPYGLGGSGF
jgi:hypothetical protein